MLAWAMQGTDPAAKIGSINNEILDYFKLIFILAGVLLLAVLVLRVWLPRVLGTRVAPSGPVQVAARLPIEPRKTLYVVKAGAEYFLIAASDSGVHFLSGLDGERIEPFLRASERPPKSEPEFSRLVRAFRRPKV